MSAKTDTEIKHEIMNDMFSVLRAASMLLLTVFVTFGCDLPGASLSRDSFQLNLREWQDDSGRMSSAELEKLLNEVIVTQLPGLENGENPVLYVRGTLSHRETEGDGAQSEIRLEGRFLYSDMEVPVHLPVKVVVIGHIDGDDAEKQKRLVLGAAGDLYRGLGANIRICNGSQKKWIAALDSPEGDEQILALSLLQLYSKKAAAGKVVELLDDPRIEVGLAATEAASELADQRHVNRIIEIAQKGGLEVEARCIRVLSSIGGKDAVAWLEMLALGHQNSQLRELSFNALKRLK